MQLRLARINEKNLLNNLLQLYLHDVSYYFPIEFGDKNGLYLYDDIAKYFDGAGSYAYFIVNDKKILGFILVDKAEETMIIQEIFVLNNYKNKGIGKLAVFKVLDKHKSKWMIKSLPGSPLAEKFWLKAIKEYTNDHFNVEYIGKYNRAVLKFKSRDI